MELRSYDNTSKPGNSGGKEASKSNVFEGDCLVHRNGGTRPREEVRRRGSRRMERRYRRE